MIAEGLEERLKEAFGTDNIEKIAKKMGYQTYQGLDHALKGRRSLTVEKLLLFYSSTNRSIHWLLTGEGESGGSEFAFLGDDWVGAIEQLAKLRGTSVEDEVRALIGEGARARAAAVLNYINEETPHESDLMALDVLIGALRKDALGRISRTDNDKVVNS